MPFQIQGNSGKVYDFDDEVPLEKAAEYIHFKEPPKTASDLPAMSLGLAKGNWTGAAAGLAQTYGDIAPEFLGGETALADAERLRAQAEQERAQAVGGATPFMRDIAGGGASVISNAPLVGLGMARGLGALAGGLGMKEAAVVGGEAALRGMVGPEALGEYGEQRGAGIGGVRSALHAGVHGLAEYVPERLAFTPLVNLLSLGKGPTLKAIGSFLGRDLVGEEATTVIEFVNQKLSRRPDATLGDLVNELQSTAVSTLVSGPLQAGMGAAVVGAAAPVARRIAPEEFEPGRNENIPRDLTPTEPTATQTAEPIVAGQAFSKDILQANLRDRFTEIMSRQENVPSAEEAVQLQGLTQQLAEVDLQTPQTAQEVAQRTLVDAVIGGKELTPAEDALIQTVQEQAVEPDPTLAGVLGTNFDTLTYQSALESVYRNGRNTWTAEHGTVLASTAPDVQTTKVLGDVSTLPAGSVTIVGAKQGDPTLTWLPIMRQMHGWMQDFLPDRSLVLSVRAFRHNSLKYDTPFQAILGGNAFGIYVPMFGHPDTSARLASYHIETLGHEFTHAIVANRFAQADAETRQRIVNAYMKWRNSAATESFERWVTSGMTKSRFEELQAVNKQLGLDFNAPAAQVLQQLVPDAKRRAYYASFDEWLAEQGSLYFSNRGYFTDPQVKRWYERVVEELRRFYEKYMSKFQAEPNFEAWMDSIRARPVGTATAQAASQTVEAQSDPIRVATEHSRYTTQYVNALPQKLTLTRKESVGLLARLPLPSAEKQLIQDVLNQPQFQRERFAREWFVDEVNRRVLELVPRKYANIESVMVTWGVDRITDSHVDPGREYTSYAGTSTSPFATVWRTPFELGNDPHFEDPYYFAHTRAFDFGSDARAVFEVQSNFFQGSVGLTAEQLASYTAKYKEHQAALTAWQNLPESARPPTIKVGTGTNATVYDPGALITTQAEIKGRLDKDARDKALARSDPTRVAFEDIWTRRIIREEIRKAAHEGKRTLRWSTADTMAKVEGWSKFPAPGQSKKVPILVNKDFVPDAYGNMLKYTGEIFTEDGNIWVRISDGSKALAIPERLGSVIGLYDIKLATHVVRAFPKMDYGSNQPIWNRHKKSIEDFVRREYSGRDVTDDLGNTWVEMDVPISAATEPVEAFSLPIHVGISNVAQTLGLKGGNYATIPHTTAKINFALKNALGAFQLLKLNENVPGAMEYKQGLRHSMQYKHEWTSEANDVLNKWLDLPPDQSAKLANLMFEEAEQAQGKGRTGFKSTQHVDPVNANRMVFVLDPAEKKRFGLSDSAAEVYSAVRSHYRAALDEMERVGISEIASAELDPAIGVTLRKMLQLKAPTSDMTLFVDGILQTMQNQAMAGQLTAKIAELRSEFATMRAKAYMPFSRFGREGVLVRDPAKNATVYFETFETRKELNAALPKIRAAHPGLAVSVTRLEDIPYMFQGVPQSFFRAVASKIGLQAGTPEYAAYLELVKDTTNAAAFVRRMKNKKGIEGYSVDAMRGYADYMKRFGNYISRVKRSGELNFAMDMLKTEIKRLEADVVNVSDTRKLHELHEWLAGHKAYIDNPGSELSEVKSLVALWYFGGNISSAVMNATQVPFVTLPYLSKRYGTQSAVRELMRAYKDMRRMWSDPTSLPADEQAMLAHALESGFLNESFATELAQIADGNALSRVHPVGRWRRATNAFNHYAMWPFQKAEEINRRATLLSAYRLARGKGFTATGQHPFDDAAFNLARGAVEDTQNEYAQEARATFMRGNWSVVFQFMSFQQNMLFQMLGGDASWKRLLLVQLFLAGLLGAPFAEDLKNLVKFLGRFMGKDWDVEREARLYMEDMDINSDLILRGMTSSAFGFDLSQRISLGQVIPGMRAVGSNKRFSEALSDATGDIAGPGIGMFLNLMRFVAQDDPNTLRQWGQIAPSGVRNLIKGVNAELEGGVTDMSGAVLHDPEWWEALGMSVGFMPEALSEAYTSRTLQQEAANYWTQRRANILREWSYIMLEKDGSREGVSDMLERVQEFNSNAPDPNLRITHDTLRRSLRARVKANLQRELGLGSQRSTANLSRSIAETFE